VAPASGRWSFPTSPPCTRRSPAPISWASACRTRRCRRFARRQQACRARPRPSASRSSASARTSSVSRCWPIGTTAAQ
jgi:hypothetical protein